MITISAAADDQAAASGAHGARAATRPAGGGPAPTPRRSPASACSAAPRPAATASTAHLARAAPGDACDVSPTGLGTIHQVELPPIDCAVQEQPLGSRAFVECADVAGRLGHDDAGGPAAQSLARRRTRHDHLVRDALADALVAAVGRDGLDVATAQRQGRGLLPLIGEAVDLDQFRCVRAPAGGINWALKSLPKGAAIAAFAVAAIAVAALFIGPLLNGSTSPSESAPAPTNAAEFRDRVNARAPGHRVEAITLGEAQNAIKTLCPAVAEGLTISRAHLRSSTTPINRESRTPSPRSWGS